MKPFARPAVGVIGTREANFLHALSVAGDMVVLAQGRVAGSFLRSQTDLETLTVWWPTWPEVGA